MFQRLLFLAVRDVGWLGKLVLAAAGVVLAVGMRAVSNLVAPGVSPYAFTYPAALLATLFGGWQPGLLALTVSELLGWLIVVPRAGLAGAPMRYQVAAALIAALTGISVIAVAHAFRMAARFGLTERGEKLAERELLFRELQHRVANDFALVASLLELQRGRSKEMETRTALEQTSHRIHSLSRIHRQIYSLTDAVSVDLKLYLSDLANDMTAGALPPNLTLTCELAPVQARRDIALALGLLMNEAVTNAIKHGFPENREGRILVRLQKSGAVWEFAVKDDGVGSTGSRTGLGTGLIRQFARQAGGALFLEQDRGTCVRLEMPLPALHSA